MKHNYNYNNNNIQTQTRLDLEFYVMGDMRMDFISFLSDCFKSNFNETLSWSIFRRFQLLLSCSPNHNDASSLSSVQQFQNWLSIYFTVIEKERVIDLIIHSFKMYEKRNMLLMFYNINDQKSENDIDMLITYAINEREKVYEGIFDKEELDRNVKRLTLLEGKKIDQDELINDLKFVTEREGCLIYKIGFEPNLVNKRTKNYKKGNNNDNSIQYEITQEIFYMNINGEDTRLNFEGMMNYLVKEFFTLVKMKYDKQFEICEISKINKKKKGNYNHNNNSISNKDNLKKIIFIIDWLVVLYIAIAIYKFFI